MPKLRIEAVKPETIPPLDIPEAPETVERFLTDGQELYARCPLHAIVGAFVARMSSGRCVVACTRCQRVLVEWQA